VPLYIVGGYIRDSLLDLKTGDIDLCSPLTVENVAKALEGTPYCVLPVNLRVGTTIICADGFKAEYTCFRSDSYREGSGAHSPTAVAFTNDIEVDARRRDFKMNAIYYDINAGKLIDILGGLDDIEKKQISAADAPQAVFGADGLRILRLVRQAAEFGFSVERGTFDAAKALSSRLKDIAAERIQFELNRILTADTAHPTLGASDAHIKGVRLLDELGALDIIFPELTAMRGLEQKKEYHLYDAFEHSLKTFEASHPRVRIAALLHDIGKLPCQENQGNMYGHDEAGASLARGRLNALKYPKAEVERAVKLIALHMYDLRGEARESKVRLFVLKNHEVIEDLFLLQRADCAASLGERPTHTERMEQIYHQMKSDGTPFLVKDLKVDGRDLIDAGVPEKKRGAVLDELLRLAALNPDMRGREAQLKFLKGRKRKE